MTTLYVTAYQALASEDRGNVVPAALEPALMQFTVTFTTAAAGSTQLNTISGTVSGTGITRARFLRLHCTGPYYARFGTASTFSSTATNSTPSPGGGIEFVGIDRDGLWISALGLP